MVVVFEKEKEVFVINLMIFEKGNEVKLGNGGVILGK